MCAGGLGVLASPGTPCPAAARFAGPPPALRPTEAQVPAAEPMRRARSSFFHLHEGRLTAGRLAIRGVGRYLFWGPPARRDDFVADSQSPGGFGPSESRPVIRYLSGQPIPSPLFSS